MSKKYICKICKFASVRHYDYKRHLSTKKHIRLATPNITVLSENIYSLPENIPIPSEKKTLNNVNFECEYCKKKIIYKKNMSRHYLICKEYKKQLIKQEKEKHVTTIEQLTTKLKEKDSILQKKIDELRDMEKEFMDFLKKVANKETVTNVRTVNMYYIVQTYLKAKNYEDIMNKPLTADELHDIRENGIYGGYNILYKRCIEGIAMQDRPFHCVDDSRSKYLLRTNNTWQIDKKGEQILEGIYPKLLQLCAPKEISGYDELDEWKRQHNNMNELATYGEQRILKKLNKVALLKNNVKKLSIKMEEE